ncbi:MAG: AIPR family protein [Magnetococcales bacterium]|nr:AIPR family protein [Magnetococcales bacterium]MBF0115937.1 AIPR family protein [Magnetococcales bacterium]
MNINAAIVDQRLESVRNDIRQQAGDELKVTDEVKLKSLAFVFLLVRTLLDLSDEETFDCLTEGGGDFGVDAMHLSEERDGEFTVSLFQAKYKQSMEGNANFPESGIKDLIHAVRYLFDPSTVLESVNDRLKAKIEEVRSLIRDGYIPQVRALACNNGLKWNDAAEEEITRSGFGNQVTWEHINHDRLVIILQAAKPVNDSLRLSGKAIVEDFNFSRVLVGRMAVTEIAALIERHGERLLERNIRRYLGLQGNRVNEGIRATLQGEESSNFYFYNNGITLICEKFSYNALQAGDYQVKVENLQIINGGQTCMTIFKTLKESALSPDAHVLVRLYQLSDDNDEQVRRITFATNSQNPVDLRDLRSNDDRQRRLQTDMEQLGYNYQRKRSDHSLKPTDITSGVAAEAILSVWRQRPHQAKFFAREHFGKLYDLVFTDDLTGAQTILAVRIYRIAENRRRRPQPKDPAFVRYASCFLAMRMGSYLLQELNITLPGLNHKTFPKAQQLLDANAESYLQKAIQDIDKALHQLYVNTDSISLQQLAATFRRGDLMEHLGTRPQQGKWPC